MDTINPLPPRRPERAGLGEVGHSRNRAYVAALDYLRALAAFTVVIYHGLIAYRGYTNVGPWKFEGWPQFWNPLAIYFVEGHTAVTLFMVLSGYVLTKGALGRELSYWRFIKNRALRIYPLYIFLMMFGVSLHPEAFSLAGFFQTLLPFANVPGSFQSEVVTALFWTVAVEFQFYLVFPFLIRFISTEGLCYAIYVIGMMMVFAAISMFYSTDGNAFAYTSIFGRLNQFLIGMSAAYCFNKDFISPKWVLPGAVAGILVMLTAYHRLGGYPLHAWWKLIWPVIEAIGWSGVILASVSSPYRMPVYLGRFTIIVANMSFSLYLIHSLVFQIIGERKFYFTPLQSVYGNGFINAFVAVPAIFALSYMTYWLIERPFMQLRVRYLGPPPGVAA